MMSACSHLEIRRETNTPKPSCSRACSHSLPSTKAPQQKFACTSKHNNPGNYHLPGSDNYILYADQKINFGPGYLFSLHHY